jgi:hypothetical protein
MMPLTLQLIAGLRSTLAVLDKIKPKVYEYGFLKELKKWKKI